ncbi:MAG: hypothetical protein ACKOTA_00810 [Solirubrobacterales bacterium]
MQTLLAYLDAGSGSMIAQILVGGFAAAGVAIKMYWKKIKNFFGRGDDEASPATAKVTEASADEPNNS